MPPSADNRSINVGGNATGVFITADHSTVTATVQVTLPPPGTVDPRAELAALHAALAALPMPDRGKLDRALQDAEEEAAKPDPDKAEIGNALQRVLQIAKGANDFAGQVDTLAPRIAALVSWLGPVGRGLLSLAGISV
jgi:hypothetical protein